MTRKLLHDSEMRRLRDFSLSFLMVWFSFGIPSVGCAQDWQVQPTVYVIADFDDNIRLNEDREDTSAEGEVTGGVVGADVRVWRQSPTGVARFRPAIRSSHYGSTSNADSDDYFLDVFFQHVTPKSEWALEARYSDEEVLSAELNDPDFDNPDIDSPVDDDSGFVTTESRRDRVVLAPRVNFRFSPRTSLWLQGQLTDTGYESRTTTFVDYSYFYLEGGVGRTLSEKNSIRISAFGRNYDPDIEGSKTESYGSFATFQHRISERNTVFVRAGYEKVDISELSAGLNVERSEGSPVFGVGVRRQFKTSRIVLDLRHSITPSGLADLRERNMARARFERNFSERTRATITARYEDTNSLSEETSLADREFARVDLDIERQLSQAWSVIGGYSFIRQEFSDAPSAETSNSLYLGIKYSPPRRQ